MDDASIHEENQVKLDKLRLYVKYILTFQKLGLRMKFLMFVESLTEAKKIATFLGSGRSVHTSIGYVHDLQKEKFMLLVPATSLITRYFGPKNEVVTNLHAEAKRSDEIWLATDPRLLILNGKVYGICVN